MPCNTKCETSIDLISSDECRTAVGQKGLTGHRKRKLQCSRKARNKMRRKDDMADGVNGTSKYHRVTLSRLGNRGPKSKHNPQNLTDAPPRPTPVKQRLNTELSSSSLATVLHTPR